MSLLLIGILNGILTAVVFRLTVPANALRDAANRIYAHLLEFRLFFDEPALIWRAQLDLIHENLRLFRMLLPVTLLLVLPFAWLSRYGTRPLHPGETAIVTAKLDSPDDHLSLSANGPVDIETKPIRIPRDRKVVWRIRARTADPFKLNLTKNGNPSNIEITYPKTDQIVRFLWGQAFGLAAGLLPGLTNLFSVFRKRLQKPPISRILDAAKGSSK